MSRILALAVALSFALPVAAAQAGTYHVYTCAVAGKTWANNAWKNTAVSGVVADTSCAGNIDRADRPGGRADGQQHALVAVLHEPGRHDDRRLHAHAPDRLRQPGRRRHAPLLRALLARRDPFRRRRRLRRRDPQRAQRAEAVVRLPGGQRRRGQEHGQPRAASPRSPPTPAPPTSCCCASGVTTAARPARSTPAARSATSSTARTSRSTTRRRPRSRSRPRACWPEARAAARTR